MTLVKEDAYLPNEDFTDETLAIDDTYGDDAIGGDWGDCRLARWPMR